MGRYGILNYSIHDRTLYRQLHIFMCILSDFKLLELDVIKLEENAGNSIPTVLCEYNRLTLYLIALGDFTADKEQYLCSVSSFSVVLSVCWIQWSTKLYMKKLSTFAEFEFSAIIVTYYVYVSIYILYTL